MDYIPVKLKNKKMFPDVWSKEIFSKPLYDLTNYTAVNLKERFVFFWHPDTLVFWMEQRFSPRSNDKKVMRLRNGGQAFFIYKSFQKSSIAGAAERHLGSFWANDPSHSRQRQVVQWIWFSDKTNTQARKQFVKKKKDKPVTFKVRGVQINELIITEYNYQRALINWRIVSSVITTHVKTCALSAVKGLFVARPIGKPAM